MSHTEQHPLSGKKLVFIGAGNMGEALIKGLLKAQAVPASNIIATARRAERAQELAQRYGITTTLQNAQATQQADVLIIAVKPQILTPTLQALKTSIQPHTLVISVAAGVPLSVLQNLVPQGTAVYRAMPNTPAVVRAGATAVAAGAHTTPEHAACVHAIFEAVGMVTEVDEPLLNAVTGLSGSGPAYVFMIIDALADAGVKVGLPRYKALALASHTVLGSAQLLIETGQHPGVLKDQVTSPGGTAIAGLHTLEEGGLRTTLINAVVAATQRSAELGDFYPTRGKPRR
jgi:pyrroline-5-carboxylate reductase